MLEDLKKEASLIRILVLLLIAAVGIYLLGIAWQLFSNFSDIFIILILAWLLSFILEPVVEKIKNLTHLSKTFSTLITYLLISAIFSGVIFLFIPLVTSQIQTLINIIPSHLESAPGFINRWGDTLISYLNNSISLVPSVAQFLFSIFLVFILSFYFVVDKEKINNELFALTPKKWHDELKFMQNAIDTSFASFLRVQLIFGLLSGVATWIVLRIFNIEFAASAALLAGLLTIIPLVGPILALIPPTIVGFIVNPNQLLIIFIILLILQQIIFNVIGPKLFSRAFRISPIVILISFLVGGKIAGFIGALFAIPVLGILTVFAKELSHRFLKRNS
ncbi:MAG: AI-2E family transporter [Candidatus Levybacteria bacterium]|nr:AI-2E family transporter [Candidatus Levybacteria bacterium]